MAKQLDSKGTVSFEDLLTSNIYTQEALVNLLDQKGIITKRELQGEIKFFSRISDVLKKKSKTKIL